MRRAVLLLHAASAGADAVCSPPPAAEAAGTEDLSRARARAVARAYQGDGAEAVRTVLNRHLATSLPNPQPCERFSLADLHAAQRVLHCSRDEALVGEYGGDRRRPRHTAAAEMAAEHANEARYVAQHPAAREAARDARCHEVAMAWTHHLSAAVRRRLSSTGLSLPLLPRRGYDEHAAALEQDGHHIVAARLAAAVTCYTGHNAQPEPRGAWKGFPDWPYEVTYNASGYGKYPFWTMGNVGGSGPLSGPGVHIQTWWSAVLGAERLDHAACSLSGLGAPDGPCTHLFVNRSGGYGWAFLYTQDESFCCVSSEPATKGACHLTRPPRDVASTFNYEGEIDYTAEDGLYSGKAKKYSTALERNSGNWFWYVTDENDKPLEQGEGPCNMYMHDGSRNCESPPAMLWHQYHQSTFKEAVLDAKVFDIPSICLDTNKRARCIAHGIGGGCPR